VIDASCRFPVAYWCTASYTLRVPRDVEMVLWSGSGAVSVAGTAADVDLSSEDGSIHASRLRSERARASSEHGAIRLGFATAPAHVDATSEHGDVTVVVPRTTDVYRVQLDTEHGSTDVHVRTDPGASRTIRGSSQHGDVTVRHPR
jgi:hypothetical protein